MKSSSDLSGVLVRYLMITCSDEIVGVEGRENSLATVLSVANILLESPTCAHALVVEG